MKKNLPFILASFAVLAAALAFFPALRNGFVNLDDNLMLLDVPVIRSLAAGHIRHIFTSYHCWLYHPLVLFSYAVEYRFFGFDPFVYHFTNYLLHLANTGLVFAVFFALTRRALVAAVVALLFGIHPLHVASVAWVSERKDVLYAFFFLAAWWAYLRYRLKLCAGDKALRWYGAAAALFLLSLLSKPAAVTLPAVLFLSDLLLMRRPDRTSYLDKLPLLALSLLFAWVTTHGFYGGGFGMPRTTALHSLFSTCYALMFYIGKLIFPVGLSCVYPLIEWQGSAPLAVLIAPALVVVLVAAAAFDARRGRILFFGIGIYLAMLAPILSRVFSGLRQVADWYMYLPSLGLFYIAAEFLAYMARGRARVAVITGVAVIGVLGYLTWHRCGVWHDSERVWNDVLNKYPDIATMSSAPGLYPNAKVAYKNRGLARAVTGAYDAALDDFGSAICLDPIYTEAFLHRASLRWFRGDAAAAFADLGAALETYPRYAEAAAMMAGIRAAQGEYDAARSWYDRAVSFDPTSTAARSGRSVFLAAAGDADGALRDLDALVAAAPFSADALNRRGVFLAERGRYAEAQRDFYAAIGHDSRLAPAYANRANIFALGQRYDLAIRDYTYALRFAPRMAGYYLARAAAYRCVGDTSRSGADIEAARRLGVAAE